MLNHAENLGSLIGVKVCHESMVSHLLFADDSLILIEADEENARTLKPILDLYCESSGQLVSAAKCSVFFIPNTTVDNKVLVCEESDNLYVKNQITFHGRCASVLLKESLH
jgi:hypothetical protein